MKNHFVDVLHLNRLFIYLFNYFIYNSYLVNESQHLRDI